jgi:hypothetical protein
MKGYQFGLFALKAGKLPQMEQLPGKKLWHERVYSVVVTFKRMNWFLGESESLKALLSL